MQATVTPRGDGLIEAVAWVIATAHQAHGYAWEAAGATVAWLRIRGVGSLVAYMHPDHQASQNVAHAVGLTATTIVIDSEIRLQG